MQSPDEFRDEPSSLLATHEGGVTTLRIDRPHRRNALDHGVLDGLIAGLRAAEARGDAAVVLTGGDTFFSSGGDVGSMPDARAGLFSPAARLTAVHDVMLAITRSDAVVVAAVEGYAIGAAWGVVLSCDLVVAADDAYFSAPFAARGLAADAGTAFHLPRALGPQRAARHLLLGERLGATEALAAGVVSETAPTGTATAVATSLAQRLAAGPRESNALTKALTARTRADLADFLAAERVAVALAGQGPDAAEGRSAFTERREPRFA